MTETPSANTTTYSVSNPYPVTAIPASVSPVPNGNLSPPLGADEEEYTIKCICGYNDDDGNTVFCEKCDTWQHIECYYHGKTVPEVHLCTDCAPKNTFADLSADKARERQRRARELIDGGGDRKVKRPNSKGQKKKVRDNPQAGDQPNGYSNHERQDSLPNGKDQPPPTKKAKTSHRATGSIISLNGESRKRAHSNVQSYPSPSKSPQEVYRSPVIPQYTADFLDLYTRDEGDTTATDNVQTIPGTLAQNAWKSDPSLVTSHPSIEQSEIAPFARTEQDWEAHQWPDVKVETHRGKDHSLDAKTPTWKLLRLLSDVKKNTILGEIRGQVGRLDEYCRQLTGPNRWKELSHPDPFVFFHPHMDLYIDSRRSGTKFRYIRRSCDPNVTMRTYISNYDQVHHCFVANQDIPAGTELTAHWYLQPTLFMDDPNRDDKQQIFQERSDYISKILANFGDCACGLPKCRLDGYDRRMSKLSEGPKPHVGRKKKPKTKHALSPLSNGQPTTSRAGSETVKGQEDDEDHRSTSGSSAHGIQSRDMTPQGGALLDEPPVLGAGLTQREIRKIQALEKAQQEKSQKGEKKQKKRPSGASTANTPGPTSRPPNTDKRYSTSPPPMRALKDVSNRSTPAKQALKHGRPVYVDVAVQTVTGPCEVEMPPFKRRKFSTPTQRLLQKLLHQRTQSQAISTSSSPDQEQQPEQKRDVEMKDATTSVSTSPSTTKSAGTSPVMDSSPQLSPEAVAPLPSQAAHTHKVHGVFKHPAPRLNLSNLPPVPAFASTTSGTPSSATTPTPPTIPFHGSLLSASSVVTPSPAKKKLSLGDYMSRRKESSTTPASEKPPTILGSSSEVQQSADDSNPPEGSQRRLSDVAPSTDETTHVKSIEDEPAIEDVPMNDVGEPTTKHAPDTSAEVQDMLSSLHELSRRQS